MDQIEVRAYETLGWWTTSIGYVHIGDDGEVTRQLLYRGDHAPIDETDPEVRAVLLLHQAVRDLEDCMRGVWDKTDSGTLEIYDLARPE